MMNQWWQNNMGNLSTMIGEHNFAGVPVGAMLLVAAWATAWKGLALWHAARREEKVWFVVLLVVNTLGILEIIYLLAVAKVWPKQQSK